MSALVDRKGRIIENDENGVVRQYHSYSDQFDGQWTVWSGHWFKPTSTGKANRGSDAVAVLSCCSCSGSSNDNNRSRAAALPHLHLLIGRRITNLSPLHALAVHWVYRQCQGAGSDSRHYRASNSIIVYNHNCTTRLPGVQSACLSYLREREQGLPSTPLRAPTRATLAGKRAYLSL